jgi:hypothetical protein
MPQTSWAPRPAPYLASQQLPEVGAVEEGEVVALGEGAAINDARGPKAQRDAGVVVQGGPKTLAEIQEALPQVTRPEGLAGGHRDHIRRQAPLARDDGHPHLGAAQVHTQEARSTVHRRRTVRSFEGSSQR